MTFGELFVVAFITVAILSASWWADLGEKVWGLWGGDDDATKPPEPPQSTSD